MRRLWLAMLLAPFAFGAHAAEEEYVTVRDRLICTTQQSLREALRGIDNKDRAFLRTVQGCHYTMDGSPAVLLQDNVSMIKIRLGATQPGAPTDFWTLPDSIKPVRGRR
jgi:hypothetical protein